MQFGAVNMRQSSHSSEVSESGFRAQLRQANLPDLVQMECLSRSHRAIRVTTVGNIGYLFFAEGQVIHACTLELDGEAAAREILLWSQGTFEPCERPWPAKPSIAKSWQALLLEAAQTVDEQTHRNVVPLPAPHWDLDEHARPISQEVETMTKNSLADANVKKEDPRLALRLNQQGGIISSHGASEDFAEMVAYACRLVEVIGDLLGMDGFQALEYASSDGRCFIYREPSGDIVVVKSSEAHTIGQLRDRLGL
jgi:hypothetical protein